MEQFLSFGSSLSGKESDDAGTHLYKLEQPSV